MSHSQHKMEFVRMAPGKRQFPSVIQVNCVQERDVEEYTIVLNAEASTLEVGVSADVDRVLFGVLSGLD